MVKRYTTRLLKTLAILYMGFPFVYLLLSTLIFDITGPNLVRILLSPSFYILSAVAAVTGYGLWEMTRWAWYTFLATNVLVGYANALIVSEYSDSNHRFLAFGVSIVTLLVLIYRVGREVRVPYFFPKIRWWESNPRYRLLVPALVKIDDGSQTQYDGQILDISLGGCFVKLREDVRQHEVISVGFEVFGFDFRLGGTVVWCSQSAVTHPKGVGVMFGNLGREEKRALRAVTSRLRKIAELHRAGRGQYTDEEFKQRLQELQSRHSPSPRPGNKNVGA